MAALLTPTGPDQQSKSPTDVINLYPYVASHIYEISVWLFLTCWLLWETIPTIHTYTQILIQVKAMEEYTAQD